MIYLRTFLSFIQMRVRVGVTRDVHRTGAIEALKQCVDDCNHAMNRLGGQHEFCRQRIQRMSIPRKDSITSTEGSLPDNQLKSFLYTSKSVRWFDAYPNAVFIGA